MVAMIRKLFSRALKSNENLQFAVLTGCLRVARESIFTGLNNLRVMTITDTRFDEQFGFSGSEVSELLKFYGLEEKYATVKEWYDGYQFGNADVYCPWDVINYVDLLRGNPNARPKSGFCRMRWRRFLTMGLLSGRKAVRCRLKGKWVLLYGKNSEHRMPEL